METTLPLLHFLVLIFLYQKLLDPLILSSTFDNLTIRLTCCHYKELFWEVVNIYKI